MRKAIPRESGAGKLSEDQIQIAVVDHLKKRGDPNSIWWHTPNGGGRSAREGAKFKAMGLLPGVSDLILHNSAGEAFALELKRDGGRPTESQMLFLSRWRDRPHHHGVVSEGLDEALAILKSWNLIR